MASPETSNAVLSDRRPDPERDDDAAVLLSGVTRVFGVSPGIVRVHLRIERGETILLRGPNGAGKTTLLRVIATAVSPTYGTGSVLGFDVLRHRNEIRRQTELLAHETRLYEDLTGAENLRFVCRIHGLDEGRVRSALQRVGLSDVAGDRVRTYSHGMRQRVAVARALLRSPELLLLDEPYAGLDVEARGVVDDAILAFRHSGRTVVLATHDPTRGEVATRNIFMDEGRIVSDGARASAGGATGGRST